MKGAVGQNSAKWTCDKARWLDGAPGVIKPTEGNEDSGKESRKHQHLEYIMPNQKLTRCSLIQKLGVSEPFNKKKGGTGLQICGEKG